MEVFILILIFAIEYLKYCMGLKLLFEEKIKRFWPFVVGFTIYIFFMTNKCFTEYEIRLIMFIIVIALIIMSIESKTHNWIIHILICIFIITCLDGVTVIPVHYFLKNTDGMPTSNLEYLICSLISFCVLITVFLAKQSNLLNYRKIIKFIRKWVYLFIAVMGIFLLITIAGLNVVNEYIADKIISIFMALVSTISGLSIMVIGAFMIYIKNANEKMEKLIESERKLKDMHIKYYQAQLEREEDTRKYRHDLSKHLVCLRELAYNNNITMIYDYIEKMQDQMCFIQRKSYYVGNEILDAILNYYLPMLEEEIEIHITGNCNENVAIDNVDLCTIFSNLVQNSVEELSNRSDTKKYLYIFIQSGKEYFSIEIRNSISSENQNRTDKIFSTIKKDKKNHGFGLKNVKDTAEKNKAIFDIKREGNEVIAKIIFKRNNLTA